MGIDIKGAGDWFKDRYEDFKSHHRATEAINEEAKAWVGKNVSKIQDVLYTQPRRDLDKIGEQGGFRGAAAKAASFGLGVGEGVFLGAKDAAAGTVGLLENVGKLLHPVEWAVKPEANLDRIKTAGETAAALAPLANPVVNPAGLEDTVNTVQALWKGITEPYEKADVAQRIGRGAFDVASLVVGGEALLGAKGAGAAAHARPAAQLSPENMERFREMYKKAPKAKAELDAIADEIATSYGGMVAKAPLKSEERALEKIASDYRGDPSRIKDLARNTIVVPADKVEAVAAELEARGATVKRIGPDSNPFGYSGVNSTIKTSHGMVGEIQVNSPQMIYAKESEPIARAILGDELYATVAAKAGVPGGEGHRLYEIGRTLTAGFEADAIAEQSRAYYDSIRGAFDGRQ